MSKKRRYPYKRKPRSPHPDRLRPPPEPTSPDGWPNYIKQLIRTTWTEKRTYHTSWLLHATKAANTGTKRLGENVLEPTTHPIKSVELYEYEGSPILFRAFWGGR